MLFMLKYFDCLFWALHNTNATGFTLGCHYFRLFLRGYKDNSVRFGTCLAAYFATNAFTFFNYCDLIHTCYFVEN